MTDWKKKVELGPTGPRFLIHEVRLLTASSLAKEEELPEPLTKKKGGDQKNPNSPPLAAPQRQRVLYSHSINREQVEQGSCPTVSDTQRPTEKSNRERRGLTYNCSIQMRVQEGFSPAPLPPRRIYTVGEGAPPTAAVSGPGLSPARWDLELCVLVHFWETALISARGSHRPRLTTPSRGPVLPGRHETS